MTKIGVELRALLVEYADLMSLSMQNANAICKKNGVEERRIAQVSFELGRDLFASVVRAHIEGGKNESKPKNLGAGAGDIEVLPRQD